MEKVLSIVEMITPGFKYCMLVITRKLFRTSFDYLDPDRIYGVQFTLFVRGYKHGLSSRNLCSRFSLQSSFCART